MKNEELVNDEYHKFKWVNHENNKIKIDAKIVPLLTKMWKLGIQTTSSCQSHCNFTCKHKYQTIKHNGLEISEIIPTQNCRNSIWIVFPSTKDVQRFYNIVAEYDPSHNIDAMYNKMGCGKLLQTGSTKYKRSLDDWSFSFLMENRGVFGHFGRPKRGKKQSTCEVWVEDGCKKNNFVIEPQLTFPKKHLDYVEMKLQLAIDKKIK